jgi:cation diffusion facilitator CzcD-associated flavoprotein CzcO
VAEAPVDGVGAAWAARYDSLHLHTVRWLSGLPGLPIPRRYGRWVARDDLVSYLAAYARKRSAEPQLGTTVTRIDRSDAADGWLVRTDHGDRPAQFRRSGTVPILDTGIVDAVRSGRIPVVAATESVDGATVHLADGSTVRPDAVVAATGFSTGLAPVVGHLGVLDQRGVPLVHGADDLPNARGLHFDGRRRYFGGSDNA